MKKRTQTILAALIFFVALNLRPAIISVGPLLTQIGTSFGWGEALLGLLGALPLLAFGALSFFVRYLTARFKTDHVLIAALIVLALGCVIRSAFGASAVWIGTVLIGGSIAVGNVLAPVIVKRDYLHHLSMATGAYSAFVTAGSALAGLSASVLAEVLGGWQGALAIWACPALLAAILWFIRLRITDKEQGEGGQGDESKLRAGAEQNANAKQEAETKLCADAEQHVEVGQAKANQCLKADPGTKTSQATPSTSNKFRAQDSASPSPQPTVPLRKKPSTWFVTLFMGLQSAAFYTFSNWLPSIATSAGFSATDASVQLFIFQALGIIAGLIIPYFMYVKNNQITAGLLASAPLLIASTGWLLTPQFSLLWSIFGGMGQGASLVVALTLIALRGTTPAETIALSGVAQSFGYLLAATGPFVFGALVEISGGYESALLFMIVVACIQCCIAVCAGKPRDRTK